MIRFILILVCAVLFAGCGVTVGVKDATADLLEAQSDKAVAEQEAKAAKIAAERAQLTNAELKKKNAEDAGIIKAAQDDIAANVAQMKANDEAHWSLIAYIAGGVLGLGVLIFSFLAAESPVARTKFVTAATFCGAAAIASLWVGREIHWILELAPWILGIAAGLGIWGAIDHRRVRTFLAGMWVKTSDELTAHVPQVANVVDRESLIAQKLQGNLEPTITKILNKVKGL